MPTERECVERERKAFVSGYHLGVRHGESYVRHGCDYSMGLPESLARDAYPLPKVTRPRVVRDPHAVGDYYWRCLSGTLYWSKERDGAVFTTGTEKHTWVVTPERVALWADLLANPTEEVKE